MKMLYDYYRLHPLRTILFCGLLLRLVAALFSKGFGMHDDHFLVIEAGQSFADGFDYNNWLPWNNGGEPSGHSWFYVGLHFLLFKFLNFIGLDDPQGKMYVVRTLHAFYSMLSVWLTYKITARMGSEKEALRAAWLIALLWFIPSVSVRNLVEWVCVPPLLASLYFVLLAEADERNKRGFFIAGMLAGVAMGIRFQSLFFLGGLGLYLLYRKEIVRGLVLFAGFLLAFFFTQSADLIFYKRPFAEFIAYVDYNLLHATTYFDRPWYQYLLTVGGMLIPPVSIFLIIGYVKAWKKAMLLVLPSLVFFLFHSWFPNKQERFILPFIPFFVMAGTLGWAMVRNSKGVEKAVAYSWRFFWVLNTLAVLVVSTTYSKRSMVEAMYFLYSRPDFNNFVMEVSHRDSQQWPPQFYSGKWNKAYCIYKEYTVQQLKAYFQDKPENSFPRYILFFQETDVWRRIATFQRGSGRQLEYVFKAEPSWFDSLLHWLNPRNKNEPVYIFRVKK
ncbi:MAG: glycosyltransferase family 39 protein [Bacteroidia bacterium]|nr:glycosyltransferase family 39 protein [Bacteroidia bacterium]